MLNDKRETNSSVEIRNESTIHSMQIENNKQTIYMTAWNVTSEI